MVSDDLIQKGNRILRGGYYEGEKQPEQLINTPGGYKSGRRPDIIYKTPTGETRAVNVGKTEANGQPVKRERESLADLNDPKKGNLPTTFVPYDR